jgi:hypothetical protein
VSDGTEDLFVVLFNNVMLRFSNVNLGRLKQFIATGDKKIALDVKKAIIVEKIEVNTQHPEGILFLQEYRDSYGDSKLLTIGKGNFTHEFEFHECVCTLGQSGIAKWGRQMSKNGVNTELCETACCDEFSLKHKWFTLPNIVFAQMCGRFLISVDCEQSMSIWDVDTLIKLYHIPNTAVQSFVVAHSENGFDHWMQLKIVALQTDNQLRIIQLPSMKVELSVPVSGQRCFLAQPQVGDKTNWANLFIEQTDGNSLVRSIGDADPRHFLNQLVRKAKFDVAKQYAATHGLDVEVWLTSFTRKLLSYLLF